MCSEGANLLIQTRLATSNISRSITKIPEINKTQGYKEGFKDTIDDAYCACKPDRAKDEPL